MGFLSSLSNKVQSADLFKTPVTFMANGKKQYGSMPAGLISLLITVFFAQMFIREAIILLNKKNIIYEQFKIDGTTTKKLGQPNDKSFMFAIGIDKLDLINGSKRYFDIEMLFDYQKRTFPNSNQTDTNSQDEYDWSDYDPSDYQYWADDNTTQDGNVSMSYIDVEASTKSENILKPCNREYWKQKGFALQFDRLDLSKWYCPSKQTNFFLLGKSTSKVFTSYKLKIMSCHETQGLAPCATEAQFSLFSTDNQGFNLKFYYIDTIISPGVQKYLTRALTDSNSWTFSDKLVLNAQVFLSQYVIQTDNSFIKDFNDFSFDSGVAIIDTISSETLPIDAVSSDTYVQFIFKRDPISHKYDRNFGKIDTLFAYIGGLFSTVVGIAGAFMSSYNKLSFEVNQMKNLYSFKKNKPFNADSFNIFKAIVYFVMSKLYNISALKNYLPKMQYYEDLHKYLQQGRKNIDMDLIIQKVMLAEKLGMVLLSKEQYKALVLSESLSFDEAKEIRSQIQMKKDVAKFLLEEEEDEEQDIELGSKMQLFQDSSALKIVDKVDAAEKKKKDMSKEEKNKVKKLESELARVMSKLQEQVDDKNPHAQRIMDRMHPIIKQRYIQPIVLNTPKKINKDKFKK